MTTLAMALPLVVSALLGLTASRAGTALPPATAVRLLAAGAFATALSLGFVLCLLAFPLLAQQPEVAELGHWSTAGARALEPLPLLAVAAGVVVTGLLVAAAARAVRGGRAIWLADAACRRLPPDAASLVIVDDDLPDAYALAGIRGRVVVSTAMLRALSPGERRVVFAHERSHLAHRHHLYVLLADLAAAADPALRPVARAVRSGIERWADEDAARAVDDRRLAATAIARAAIARARVTRRPGAESAMGATDGVTAARALALLRPRPRPRRLLATALAVAVSAAVAGATFAGQVTESGVDRAQAAYVASADR